MTQRAGRRAYPAPGFGAKIHAARVHRSMTAKQLADKIRLPVKNPIYMWEKEANFPGPKYLEKLCSILGLEVPDTTESEICVVCNARFPLQRNTTGKYCSRACWYKRNRGFSKSWCPVCGDEFARQYAEQKFCSVSCANKKRGKNSGNTRRINSMGYIEIKVGKNYPSARSNGWMLEHRYVMEMKLGRTLYPNEYVHHKDGNRRNNNEANIELWKRKDPAGVRASDYHCPGCRCGDTGRAD